MPLKTRLVLQEDDIGVIAAISVTNRSPMPVVRRRTVTFELFSQQEPKF
jgi:hypothetical protein